MGETAEPASAIDIGTITDGQVSSPPVPGRDAFQGPALAEAAA